MRGLKVDHLYKSYGEKVLFNQISFSIGENDRIGLIGVNGTGKSSLLKVLAGIDTAESGEFEHPNDYLVEYLDQDPELDDTVSVMEYIYNGEQKEIVTLRKYEKAALALENNPTDEKLQQQLLRVQQEMDEIDAWDAMTRAKTILSKLGVTKLDQQISALSGGQKKRVAIAKAFIQPADLLILDEPTNHLDNDTIEWLEEFLPQYKGALLLVTHDRYFLNRVTNRIFELDKGKLYTYQGNYQIFLEKKAEREEQEVASEKKHKNVLKQELAWLHRGAKARTTKQKARIGRVEEMKDKTFDTKKESVAFAVGANRLGTKVLEVEGLTKGYGNEMLFENLDFLVKPHDRIGIVGANGSGKTTLLNILAGQIEPDKGFVEKGSTVKIGYYTQNHPAIPDDLKVIEFIRDVAEVVHTQKGDIITAEQMLEQFLFPRSMQWTYVKRLSGGERRRLYLLSVLMKEPNVLFLDEPTNDLDTQTLMVLEDYLENFPGVVITVSHDRYFLDKTVDQLLAFDGSGNVIYFYGNYSEYREQEKVAETPIQKEKSKPLPEKKKRKKLSYNDQKEWETIEDTIGDIEGQIESVQQDIEDAGSDSEKIQKLYKKQQQLEQELEFKMERWEELSLLVEEMD
ncbi:ABC-F family ATP-binding cassette domain-containing protein [Saliterribacillus persicus]|uniref:ATP-binding cassette subfamily F protein uup n=1 Tax=Saliterribacillus persicus TaxID=930114 RepID=A0A368YF70_9BACI|nr:ABC-F family ATP-binding cassette domain-containing protein [Saliterribacillus persicus]RCW77517.1 ATP-binding cassette subfamily F protein uup [Saliterribacillus persicus]